MTIDQIPVAGQAEETGFLPSCLSACIPASPPGLHPGTVTPSGQRYGRPRKIEPLALMASRTPPNSGCLEGDSSGETADTVGPPVGRNPAQGGEHACGQLGVDLMSGRHLGLTCPGPSQTLDDCPESVADATGTGQ